MKKWKCLVCGYVHEGDSPPERCPKCGAPKEKFVLISDSDGQAESKVTGLSGESFEADVLVVGSGAAAFSAAITARNEGAEVIMLEKAEMVGGTTIRSGGGFWIPNNRHQKELGIEDKKEDAK